MIDASNINIDNIASVNSINNVKMQNTNSALTPKNIHTINFNVENHMDAVALNNSAPNSSVVLSTGSTPGLTSSSELTSTMTSSSAVSSRSREPNVVRMPVFQPPQTDFSFFIADPKTPDVMPPIDVPVDDNAISNAATSQGGFVTGSDTIFSELIGLTRPRPFVLNDASPSFWIDPAPVDLTLNGMTSSGNGTATRTVVTRTETTVSQDKVITSNTVEETSGSAADVISGTSTQNKPTP
ncbi:uncharacterized protein LOC127866742 [Dreissena polymorpha]|uniref:Uncharacterized protein n=1 Tax=Dreissena polymorpha TaxID=45954 RepID=A0A9D4S1R0_DREPO|nr:uncharacterized protein LOC127866742 [Dreissena polymorpha]KAH3886667.1 hypothetical protein DPMN_010679 [Dreissena polymorpha]